MVSSATNFDGCRRRPTPSKVTYPRVERFLLEHVQHAARPPVPTLGPRVSSATFLRRSSTPGDAQRRSSLLKAGEVQAVRLMLVRFTLAERARTAFGYCSCQSITSGHICPRPLDRCVHGPWTDLSVGRGSPTCVVCSGRHSSLPSPACALAQSGNTSVSGSPSSVGRRGAAITARMIRC